MYNSNNSGRLQWGGADCLDLAERFGTPLYVFDDDVIKERCGEIRRDFLERWQDTSACYSGKAFLTSAMVKIVEREGLGLDVVSLGELHTALAAGFPPDRIEFHGNAKSIEEMSLALSSGVGRIILDSTEEAEVLSSLAVSSGKRAKVLIRVAPGVDAHTHKFISTGQTGSKFGVPIDALTDTVRYVLSLDNLELTGVHFHVGSQIFETDAHVKSVSCVTEALGRVKRVTGFEAREINFGGGYGAVSNPSLPHVRISAFTDAMMEELERGCAKFSMNRPHTAIEAGRWIISEAGITLYRVEFVKELDGIVYVSVNGGMSDNPRYPLYGAVYDAVKVSEPNAPKGDWGGARVSMVGKCCESGDILIEDAHLPRVKRGDIVALFNTGAYTYSMASGYNMALRPAAVLAGGGRAELIVRRQTPYDLIACDIIPRSLA